MNHYLKLGELLVQRGFITNLQLSVALSAQQTTNRRLGEIVVERGFATEDQMAECLAEQYNYPLLDPDGVTPESEALARVPSNIALTYCVLPMRDEEDCFVCALADPIDVLTTDLLSQIVRKRLVLHIGSRKRLTKAIRRAYRLEQAPPNEPVGEAALLPDRFINARARRRLGVATMLDAFDRELDRKVTMFTVPTGTVEEWELYQLVRAAARTQHRSVCAVYDWIESGGQRWCVCEPLEGETLDQMLKTRGPRTIAQAAEMVAQIADGVEALNQNGGRCGLIAPTNVLVRWSGPLLTPLTTPHASYGCPEQAEVHGNPTADVYALGTLLWESVTGQNPHAGEGAEIWWSDVKFEAKRFPTAFRKVLEGCLDPDPVNRFGSAFHLANTLRAQNWSALSHADESARFDKSGDREELLQLLAGEDAPPTFWQRLFGRKRAA